MSLDLEAIRQRADAMRVASERCAVTPSSGALQVYVAACTDAGRDVPALLDEIEHIDRDRDRLQESLTDMQVEAEQLHARADAAEQERDALKAERDELTKLAARLSRTLAGTDDRTADRP